MKVFVINVPERIDRLDAITKELNQLGLEFEVWVATKEDNGVIGLLNTMIGLLKHCIENGIESALFLEDDATFLQGKDVIEKCISQLPEDFDLFYLGAKFGEAITELYSENLFNIKHSYTTHAIYYSAIGMKKLLFEIEDMLNSNRLVRPLDVLIMAKIQKQGNCYCSFPLIASQRSSFSDIEKREVNYEPFIVQRYYEHTKHLKWQ